MAGHICRAVTKASALLQPLSSTGSWGFAGCCRPLRAAAARCLSLSGEAGGAGVAGLEQRAVRAPPGSRGLRLVGVLWSSPGFSSPPGSVRGDRPQTTSVHAGRQRGAGQPLAKAAGGRLPCGSCVFAPGMAQPPNSFPEPRDLTASSTAVACCPWRAAQHAGATPGPGAFLNHVLLEAGQGHGEGVGGGHHPPLCWAGGPLAGGEAEALHVRLGHLNVSAFTDLLRPPRRHHRTPGASSQGGCPPAQTHHHFQTSSEGKTCLLRCFCGRKWRSVQLVADALPASHPSCVF